jgi:hypothetical protein
METVERPNGCEFCAEISLAQRPPNLSCNQTVPAVVQPELDGHCLEYLLRGLCLLDLVSRAAKRALDSRRLTDRIDRDRAKRVMDPVKVTCLCSF